MTNELIKVTTNEEGKNLVSAKELYDGLGLNRSEWSRWYKRNIESNEFFKENVDWVGFVVTPNRGGKSIQDFAISLEFAKHIAMMARTEKSHTYRNYFIQCEKKLAEVQEKANLLLSIYGGGQAGVVAAKRLTEIEVAEATKELVAEVEHKEDVIFGLVENIDLAEKRQRISQIIRHNAKGRFQERYKLLYDEFSKKYHVDIKRRLENAKDRGEVKKSVNQMAYICDYMNKTAELYEIACKIFENDFEQLKREMWEVVA